MRQQLSAQSCRLSTASPPARPAFSDPQCALNGWPAVQVCNGPARNSLLTAWSEGRSCSSRPSEALRPRVRTAHSGLKLCSVPACAGGPLRLRRRPCNSLGQMGCEGQLPPRHSRRMGQAGQRYRKPHPCGYLAHPRLACRCSERVCEQYGARVSGPLLDRIDIHVSVPPVEVARSCAASLGTQIVSSLRQGIRMPPDAAVDACWALHYAYSRIYRNYSDYQFERVYTRWTARGFLTQTSWTGASRTWLWWRDRTHVFVHSNGRADVIPLR